MLTYDIIPLTEAYIEEYRAALDVVARERKFLALLEAPSLEKSRAFVLAGIQQGMPHYIVVRHSKVIGWCDISSLYRPVYAHCGVLGMGILPAYRGQGIGKNLLLTALAGAKEIGLTRIELTVRENNKPAIKLYEALGFIQEGIKRKAVRLDNTYEDLLCYAILFE